MNFYRSLAGSNRTVQIIYKFELWKFELMGFNCIHMATGNEDLFIAARISLKLGSLYLGYSVYVPFSCTVKTAGASSFVLFFFSFFTRRHVHHQGHHFMSVREF